MRANQTARRARQNLRFERSQFAFAPAKRKRFRQIIDDKCPPAEQQKLDAIGVSGRAFARVGDLKVAEFDHDVATLRAFDPFIFGVISARVVVGHFQLAQMFLGFAFELQIGLDFTPDLPFDIFERFGFKCRFDGFVFRRIERAELI